MGRAGAQKPAPPRQDPNVQNSGLCSVLYTFLALDHGVMLGVLVCCRSISRWVEYVGRPPAIPCLHLQSCGEHAQTAHPHQVCIISLSTHPFKSAGSAPTSSCRMTNPPTPLIARHKPQLQSRLAAQTPVLTGISARIPSLPKLQYNCNFT